LKTDTKPFVLKTGTSGSLVDQISMNMSITADSSGSLTLNGIRVDYAPPNLNEIKVDGHTIDINTKYLPDGVTANPDYPTYTVDGQSVIPNNTSGSINFQGAPISVDYSTGSPVFSVAGTTINTSGSTNLTPSGSVSFIYSGGALITSSGSVAPITPGSNSYYVSGVKITVDPADQRRFIRWITRS